MTTPLLHGVCAAMTSPFDDTGEHLDEGRLRDHIEAALFEQRCAPEHHDGHSRRERRVAYRRRERVHRERARHVVAVGENVAPDHMKAEVETRPPVAQPLFFESMYRTQDAIEKTTSNTSTASWHVSTCSTSMG